MSQNTSKIPKDSRIAIIGAGPAGLSTAWFLAKHGFENVTVLEKLGRVGGLCKSITIKGMSYDIGANYVTWAYTETLKIADELGAETYEEKPYTSIEINEDGTSARYRPLEEAVLYNPIKKKKIKFWDLMVAAIRYLIIRFKIRKIIDRPDYLAKINKETHPELCKSFMDWLRDHRLDDLTTLFEFPITIMGYGQLRHIATPYALRYMSLKTFFPMVVQPLPLIGPILSLFFPWPRRFSEGFQRLWERVAWFTNVRLNIKINSIKRDPTAAESPIIIDFNKPHQEMNELDYSENVKMHFDYLILACPLTQDVFDGLKLDKTPGEDIFKKIHINPYCMTTYWVDNMDMPEPIAPILPLPKIGKPWAVARQFQHNGNHFTQFYTRTKESKTLEEMNQDEVEVKKEVKKLIELLNGKIDETHSKWETYDRFTYFQHVEPEDIADGFYKKLADLQGQDRTFYVGGVTDFELIEPIVQHSKYLVEKHFVGL